MLFGFTRIQRRHIPGFQRGILPDRLPDDLRTAGKGLHRDTGHLPHTVLTDHFRFIAQRFNLLFQHRAVNLPEGYLVSIDILDKSRFSHLITAQGLPFPVMQRDVGHHGMGMQLRLLVTTGVMIEQRHHQITGEHRF
ncbi:Uncharacterised protein [Salmonella enterica subsp. enterica serovar Braenderup]|nr:Uncharacterised protein [Salmonella enterica subsp. enterica serovar Braenderup]